MKLEPGQLIRWGSPLGGNEIFSFYNHAEKDGVIGLSVRSPDGTTETGCLLADLNLFTQKTMFSLTQAGCLYEAHTSAIVGSALRPGDMVIDVGAHIGFFTLLSRLCVGPSGHVLAFEPLPATFQRLFRNIVGNHFCNVSAIPLALSNRAGEATFFIDQNNEGESSLLLRPGSNSCTVQTTTLDSLLDSVLSVRPRLLKLDAEGFEIQILKGGAQLFKNSAPDLVICEYNKGAMQSAGANIDDLLSFFIAHGYRYGVINNESGLNINGATFYRMLESPSELATVNDEFVMNLMFVRPESGLFTVPQQ